MAHGTVRDLAVQLGCILKLEGGVAAASDVSELTVAELYWKGLLSSQPTGPLLTQEGREVWIVVKDEGRKVELVGDDYEGR